ncbi:MAG: response regulator, partial [Candidatus Omnitrophota bacterium]
MNASSSAKASEDKDSRRFTVKIPPASAQISADEVVSSPVTKKEIKTFIAELTGYLERLTVALQDFAAYKDEALKSFTMEAGLKADFATEHLGRKAGREYAGLWALQGILEVIESQLAYISLLTENREIIINGSLKSAIEEIRKTIEAWQQGNGSSPAARLRQGVEVLRPAASNRRVEVWRPAAQKRAAQKASSPAKKIAGLLFAALFTLGVWFAPARAQEIAFADSAAKVIKQLCPLLPATAKEEVSFGKTIIYVVERPIPISYINILSDLSYVLSDTTLDFESALKDTTGGAVGILNINPESGIDLINRKPVFPDEEKSLAENLLSFPSLKKPLAEKVADFVHKYEAIVVTKRQPYRGPYLLMHGDGRHGKHRVGYNTLAALTNFLSAKYKLDRLLWMSCNASNGAAGEVNIPIIHASWGVQAATTGLTYGEVAPQFLFLERKYDLSHFIQKLILPESAPWLIKIPGQEEREYNGEFAGENNNGSSPLAQKRAAWRVSSPVRILVADDEIDYAKVCVVKPLQDELSDLPAEFTLASNGREALEQSRANKFDVVITDLNMPEMDGLQLAAALRDIELYQKTPIFVISTYTADDHGGLARALSRGIINKSFRPDVSADNLAKVIRDALAASASSPLTEIEGGRRPSASSPSKSRRYFATLILVGALSLGVLDNAATNSEDYLLGVIHKQGWKVFVLSEKEWEANEYLGGESYKYGGAIAFCGIKTIFYGGVIPSDGHLTHEVTHVLQDRLSDEELLSAYDGLLGKISSKEAKAIMRRLMSHYMEIAKYQGFVGKERVFGAGETLALIHGMVADMQSKPSQSFSTCHLDEYRVAELVDILMNEEPAKRYLIGYYIKLGFDRESVNNEFGIRNGSGSSPAAFNDLTTRGVEVLRPAASNRRVEVLRPAAQKRAARKASSPAALKGSTVLEFGIWNLEFSNASSPASAEGRVEAKARPSAEASTSEGRRAASPAANEEKPARSTAGNKPILLVVEDEPKRAEGFTIIIGSKLCSALEIKIVGNGEEALAAIKELSDRRIVFITTDVEMPVMDGIALINSLSSLQKEANITIPPINIHSAFLFHTSKIEAASQTLQITRIPYFQIDPLRKRIEEIISSVSSPLVLSGVLSLPKDEVEGLASVPSANLRSTSARGGTSSLRLRLSSSPAVEFELGFDFDKLNNVLTPTDVNALVQANSAQEESFLVNLVYQLQQGIVPFLSLEEKATIVRLITREKKTAENLFSLINGSGYDFLEMGMKYFELLSRRTLLSYLANDYLLPFDSDKYPTAQDALQRLGVSARLITI